MVSWCHGVMVSWCHGVMVSWCHGVMVSWCTVEALVSQYIDAATKSGFCRFESWASPFTLR